MTVGVWLAGGWIGDLGSMTAMDRVADARQFGAERRLTTRSGPFIAIL